MKKNDLHIKSFLKRNHNQPDLPLVSKYLFKFYHNKKINLQYNQLRAKAIKHFQRKQRNDTELIISFPSGYSIIRLISQNSRTTESMHMRNCLKDYGEHHGLYSLRNSQGVPKVNFEIKSGKIYQINGFNNNGVAPKYIAYVQEFYKHFNFPFTESDLENLGYIGNVYTWFSIFFTELMVVEFQNKKFVYKKNKWQLKNDLFDFNNSHHLFFYLIVTRQCDEAIVSFLNNKFKLSIDNYKAFSIAQRHNHLDLIELFLNHTRALPPNYPSILRLAADQNNVTILNLIIRMGGSLDGLTKIRRECVHYENPTLYKFFKRKKSPLIYLIDKMHYCWFKLKNGTYRLINNLFPTDL